MARSVRMIDSSDYGRVRPDVEFVEPGSYGSYGGRYSIALILILLLVVVWVYRNGSARVLGRWVSQEPSAELSASEGVNPVESDVPPVEPPVASPIVPSAVPAAPVVSADQHPDVIGYTRVAVDRLNLRAGPGIQYVVINVLPRSLEVAVLRQVHIANNGEAWVEIMAPTDQGWQKGWVSQRRLE